MSDRAILKKVQEFLTSVGIFLFLSTTCTTEIYSQCTLLYSFNGESAEDEFGKSVSGAGDVNNDGFDDLIVGAWHNDAGGNQAGRAYVYSGQDGTLLYTFTGETEVDQFGISVSGAGDVNNDGFDDVIIGALFGGDFGSETGMAYVYSGLDGSLIHKFIGEMQSDQFGFSVSGAGDVNNDGFDDVIVGAWRFDNGGYDLGRAYVYSGENGNLLYAFTGEVDGDVVGFSVSSAGDVNKDGFDDLIVGAPGVDDGRGKAFVYSGQSGALLYEFGGEAVRDLFGVSVSGVGDANNDGTDDLAIGALSNDFSGLDAGRAYLYSGQNGDLLSTFEGEVEEERFGASVCGAGDINSDGFDDIIVASYFFTGVNGQRIRRIKLFSGQSSKLLYEFTERALPSTFGQTISGAGDTNNDGFDDFIVGGLFNEYGDLYAGKVNVFLGSSWICADSNKDSLVTIDDVNYLTNFYFHCDDVPCPYLASDLNCDGSVDISDIIYLQRYLDGGPEPCCFEQ